MPISDRHKVIFVHIPKTGGTSIEEVLGVRGTDNKGNPDKNIWILYGHQGNPNTALQHLTSLEIKSIVSPEVFASYFKFAFVRNPYDRLVSEYHWRKHLKTIPQSMNFKDFVAEIVLPGMSTDRHLFNQVDYIADRQGKIMVDFVGRFENFIDDWNKVSKQLQLRRPIGHINASRSPEHEYYSEYYDNSLRKEAGRLFKKDLEAFDYRFQRKSKK